MPLLLSVDFEDWHQLVRRRLGVADWERPGPALARQTESLLTLLEDLQAKATFFILGMAARAHPELIAQVVQAGHEIGCHGDRHVLVHRQTREQFADDLREAVQTIEQLTGTTPRGYRAPAFSITLQTPWAYEVLAEQGFRYDASQYDSPRIRNRIATARVEPYPIADGLWEFPVAVSQTGSARIPVGGASYWALLPNAVVLKGLATACDYAGLYLHPHEFDPRPLRVELAPGAPAAQRVKAAARSVQRNSARRGAPETLRAIGRRFELIPYGEAYGRLSRDAPARP